MAERTSSGIEAGSRYSILKAFVTVTIGLSNGGMRHLLKVLATHPPTSVPAKTEPSTMTDLTSPLGANTTFAVPLPVGPSSRLQLTAFWAAAFSDPAAASRSNSRPEPDGALGSSGGGLEDDAGPQPASSREPTRTGGRKRMAPCSSKAGPCATTQRKDRCTRPADRQAESCDDRWVVFRSGVGGFEFGHPLPHGEPAGHREVPARGHMT
jgi:hypothetical protein